MDLSRYSCPPPGPPGAHPGDRAGRPFKPAWRAGVSHPATGAHAGGGIPANLGRRVAAAVDRGPGRLSGLRKAHPGGLAGLSKLPDQAQEALPSLRSPDGTALEYLPVLRYAGPGDAEGK